MVRLAEPLRGPFPNVKTQQLAAFVLPAVAAGIAAAVIPARRAARLNVLQALEFAPES